MAALKLDSLVLQLVSVVADGLSDALRLGTHEGILQAKAIPFSMRHPSLDCRTTVPFGGQWPFFVGNPTRNSATWSGSRAGVLVRRSPAITAGGTSPQGWLPNKGGPQSMAAMPQCPKRAWVSASVAYETSRDASDQEALTAHKPR